LSVACRDGDESDLLDVLELADGVDEEHLVIANDSVSPGIAVVLFEGRADVVNRQIKGDEGVGRRNDLKGSHLSAERIDVGDTLDREESRADDPVEHTTQLHVVVALAFDEEHVDIREWHRDRSETTLDALRQLREDLADALRDLLARPVNVGAVREIDRDDGERVFGQRSQHCLAGNPPDFRFERVGDALFDLAGSHPGSLDDDLDLGVRDVREGIDGEIAKGANADAGEDERENDEKEALRERELDEVSEHGDLLVGHFEMALELGRVEADHGVLRPSRPADDPSDDGRRSRQSPPESAWKGRLSVADEDRFPSVVVDERGGRDGTASYCRRRFSDEAVAETVTGVPGRQARSAFGRVARTSTVRVASSASGAT
jgi:hypothetical protein